MAESGNGYDKGDQPFLQLLKGLLNENSGSCPYGQDMGAKFWDDDIPSTPRGKCPFLQATFPGWHTAEEEVCCRKAGPLLLDYGTDVNIEVSKMDPQTKRLHQILGHSLSPDAESQLLQLSSDKSGRWSGMTRTLLTPSYSPIFSDEGATSLSLTSPLNHFLSNGGSPESPTRSSSRSSQPLKPFHDEPDVKRGLLKILVHNGASVNCTHDLWMTYSDNCYKLLRSLVRFGLDTNLNDCGVLRKGHPPNRNLSSIHREIDLTKGPLATPPRDLVLGDRELVDRLLSTEGAIDGVNNPGKYDPETEPLHRYLKRLKLKRVWLEVLLYNGNSITNPTFCNSSS